MTREKVIEGLEYLITAYAFHGEDDECLGEAVELLKELENEIQIASTQGFYEGYNQAMSEMPKEIKHMTNNERFDMKIIREIREGNGNVRYIRTGSYVVMRRDIYDRYREKVGELGCG